jgi:serine/threonine protein kinase
MQSAAIEPKTSPFDMHEPPLSKKRTMTSVIGSQILHYHVLRQLGAGGMGVVYEALDNKLERLVALKFLSESLHHNPSALERFRREAKAVSKLDHPNIGALFALEQFEHQTFLAMALYQGQTMATRLEQGRVALPDALRIAVEMARGLEHAHGQGVIHRDIKPANVFLAKMPNGNELVKILDFGLARLEDSSQQLTRPGATTGTLLYMSPEQLSGVADAKSDLWAWGAVVYEMLAGKPMFQVDGIGALLNAILHTQPKQLAEHRPETPTPFANMVMQAVAKNPQDRPNDMRQIVTTLEALISGEILHSHSAEVTVLATAPEQAPSQSSVAQIVKDKTIPALDSLVFNNPSSWDTTLPVATVDTTKDEVVIRVPRRRFPWLLALPILAVLAFGAWFLLPRSPDFERCEPLNTTGQMLDSAIKWAAPLVPLENCGSFGFGEGSATSEYVGATEVKRQVLALLPGTVLVADAVQMADIEVIKSMLGLKGAIKNNATYAGSGQQFFIGGNTKVLTLLYPTYIETSVSGEALAVRAQEPSKQSLSLNVFQVDEVDTDIQRLDVTTADEHSQNFVGALFGGKTAVFLGVGANATPANFNVNVPLGISRYIITGMPPGKSYDLEFEPDRGWNYITLKPGRSGTVNSAGVLVLGEKMKSIR